MAKMFEYWADARYGSRGRPLVSSYWFHFAEWYRRLSVTLMDMAATKDHMPAAATIYCLCTFIISHLAVLAVTVALHYRWADFTNRRVRLAKKALRPAALAGVAVMVMGSLTVTENRVRADATCASAVRLLTFSEQQGASGAWTGMSCDQPAGAGFAMAVFAFLCTAAHAAVHAGQDLADPVLAGCDRSDPPARVMQLSGTPSAAGGRCPAEYAGWTLTHINGAIVAAISDARRIADGEVELTLQRWARPAWWIATNAVLVAPAVVCFAVSLAAEWVNVRRVAPHGVERAPTTDYGVKARGATADIPPGLADSVEAQRSACTDFPLAYVVAGLIKAGTWMRVCRKLPNPVLLCALSSVVVTILHLRALSSVVIDEACRDTSGEVFCVREWAAGIHWFLSGVLLTWVHWWFHYFQDKGLKKAAAKRGATATALKVRANKRRTQLTIFANFATEAAEPPFLQWHELEAALHDGALGWAEDGEEVRPQPAAVGGARASRALGMGRS
eukprot:gene36339-39861_t